MDIEAPPASAANTIVLAGGVELRIGTGEGRGATKGALPKGTVRKWVRGCRRERGKGWSEGEQGRGPCGPGGLVRELGARGMGQGVGGLVVRHPDLKRRPESNQCSEFVGFGASASCTGSLRRCPGVLRACACLKCSP